MDLSPQIEPTSTARLLTSLSFAIDEIKLINSIKSFLITPEAQPVIQHIPDNDVLKNHTG
jgi:hypothetical protein